MSIPILICDDSSFAQKQLLHSLPEDWDVIICYAKNGKDALKMIKEKRISVLFLDLNMPVMDGYAVLAQLNNDKSQVRTVVVSGDIQPEAYKRVIDLGALDFIRKPVDKDELVRVIEKHGLDKDIVVDEVPLVADDLDLNDAYREVTNVAMGQAASLLAQVLDVFVVMPIPVVNMIEITELQMAITNATEQRSTSAICQGFIGGGLAGEAMLLFSDSSYEDMAKLMHYDGELDDVAEMELLMDLTNILIGACMNGIAEQFDIKMSLGHPIVLGRHMENYNVNKVNGHWKSTLAIDLQIAIENRNVNANLMLLFTEDSIPRFNQLISYVAA